jgi:membrane dipeptidase
MHKLFFLLILSSMISCNPSKSRDEASIKALAQEIHDNSITLDTHVDINPENFTPARNYTTDLETQVTLPKMEKGGLDVAWFIVYTGQDSLSEAGYETASRNALEKFEAIHRLCEEFAPQQIALALNSEEVRKIHASGRKVAMIGVENAYPMGTDLSNFKKYHDLGARYVSLAHNGHSQFCDSHTGEESQDWLHNGLSDLGIRAVDSLNKLGIMIDVSHVSRNAMMQICDLSKAPVIASHSSARTLCDHSRNLDDQQLDQIKVLGGVVQTVALGTYLNEEKSANRLAYMEGLYKKVADSLNIPWYKRSERDSLNAMEMENYLETYPTVKSLANEKAGNDPEAPPAVDVADLVNHIDYMVNRIGIDHVGISSDFDGGGGIEGWKDASETFNVTLELVRRGYSEEEIAKLWSGNLLRVLDEVQRLAR